MLRLSEAASRLGIAPSTLRAFTDRGLIAFSEMPNGERRFEESAVEAFRQAGASGARATPRESAPAPVAARPRRPPWKDVPPWERPALAAEAEIRIEKAKREIARLEADDAARGEEVERARLAAKAADQEEERRRREVEQKERAEKIAECLRPVTEAVNIYVARRKEQQEREAEEVARSARANAARIAALPEDRRLQSMEAQYQERKALFDLAALAKKLRR